jgi:hypothetical protein
MAATNTINIRGSKLYEVTSTSDTATSTAVTAVVNVESLPEGTAAQRVATELDDTAVVRLAGRLKDYGTFAYSINVTAAGITSILGTSKILRLDIPADKDGTATTHEILRVWMAGGYTGEAPQPGGDAEEVTIRRTFSLTGAPVYGTATASII